MKFLIYFLLAILTVVSVYAQDVTPEKPKDTEPPAAVQTPVQTPAPAPVEKEPVKEPAKETPAEPVKEPVKEQPAVKTQPAQPAVSAGSEDARLLAQLEANPKNVDLYNRLIRLYTNDGRHKEKLKIALKQIQNLGGSANLYIIVGDENKYLGDYSKALISYQFALKMQPTDHTIYNRIGLILLKMSNFNQAESAFKASLFYSVNENAFTRGIYYNNLGVAYEWMHDLKGAYRYFQTALKYYPSYGTASENIARVKASMKGAGIQYE